jgi:glycosyltransferase involved in cell wall biosynthesis
MKEILLVHHRLPFPLTNGMDKLRFNLIRLLSKRYNITLVIPVFNETRKEWVDLVKLSVKELITVPAISNEARLRRSRSVYLMRLLKLIILQIPNYATDNYYADLAQRLNQLLKEKKFYFIQFLSDFSAYYLKDIPLNNYIITGPMDDTIEATRLDYQFAARGLKRVGLWLIHRATKKHFTTICQKSDLVLFHSFEDMHRVKLVLGSDFNSGVLPVATDMIEVAENPTTDIEENSMIFVGGLGTTFNQDAVFYFVKEILPAIRKRLQDVTLYLVGNNPPQSIIELGSDMHIIVTGEVADVRPFIRKAAVYISPLRIGTGIKTKIIEALSLSKALVVSPASLQGLWEIDDTLFVCGDNNEFADRVVDLFQNSDLRQDYEKRSAALYNKAYALSKVEPITMDRYFTFEKQIPD